MRLYLGSFEFDAKGLPRVYSLRVTPSHTGEGPVTVSILLDSCKREAVAKWAARLGVEVVDRKPRLHRGGDRVTHTYEAVLESEGCRVKVWTSLDQNAPAEPLEAEDPAVSTCPCGCTSTFCRCTDPQTCSCKPACPVCDRDGGA
jgi:hypothetical protein